jgi:hypothetical protein
MHLLGSILLLCSTGTATATPFDGAYDSTIERCYRASDMRYILSGDRAEGWENICNLTNPTSVRDIPNAMIYDAICSGEGERYSYRLMLVGNTTTYIDGWRQADVDLYVITNGSVTPLLRCPPGVGTIMYQ